MSTSRKLFGTDGVRGVANAHPVTPELALRLGRAAAQVLTAPTGTGRPFVVIGRDTRRSGDLLESALTAGLLSAGVDVLPLGVLPTPAVALCARDYGAAAGVVLSASHNPAPDNGIKFFRGDGYKLDDEQEARLEALVEQENGPRPTGGGVGRLLPSRDATTDYAARVAAGFPAGLTLAGLRIVLDCAHGAAFRTSPAILRQLGADLIVHHDSPDGLNINEGCGSTHPGELIRLVRATGAQVGISHDGDADRLILCDENGEIVDGDEIMAIAAVDFLRSGTLASNTLVTTVMSNFGLDETVASHGGRVLRTAVGDRYVMEAMLRENLNVGGEQSGHMIFRDHATTGDGIVSALQILRIMVQTSQPLSVLKGVLKKYPQAQRNLRVREKLPLDQLPSIQAMIADTEAHLAGAGRVLLRYSGTEPKIRLLIEGRDAAWIEARADAIASAIHSQIGD